MLWNQGEKHKKQSFNAPAMLSLQNFLAGGVTGLPVLDLVAASRYGDLIAAGIILGVSLCVAFFVHFLMNLYLSTIAKRTKTTVDDAVFSALKKPMYLTAIVTGLYLALSHVGALLAYAPAMTRLYQAAAIAIIAYTASRVVTAIISWPVRKVYMNK